jgi:hypothetical protein
VRSRRRRRGGPQACRRATSPRRSFKAADPDEVRETVTPQEENVRPCRRIMSRSRRGQREIQRLDEEAMPDGRCPRLSSDISGHPGSHCAVWAVGDPRMARPAGLRW